MPRQSSGTYSAPANTAAVSNQTISSTAYNSLQTDIGNELTNSLDRQGRGGMEANLPMGGYKITNLGDPSAVADAMTKGYSDSNYLSSAANSVSNTSLAQAPAGTVKGTAASAATANSTVTLTVASPCVVSWSAHGLAAGTPIVFKTTGALPTGLDANTPYYVVGPLTNSFNVATTVGGSAINTSGTQSGAHTAFAYAMTNETDLSFAYVGQQISDGVPMTPIVINLKITNNGATPDTKIDVTADYAVVSNASGNGRHSSISGTINLTTTGANALDTGSLANSTWYNVFVISTGSAVALLASTSATSPTLPAGYFYSLRVGAMRTDGSSKLYRTMQRGRRTQWTVAAGTNVPAMPAITASGASGNINTPTWTAASVANLAPTTAQRIMGVLSGTGGSTIMVAPNNAYGSYTSTTNPPPAVISGISMRQGFDFLMESTSIYYAVDASGPQVFALGWEDAVPAF